MTGVEQAIALAKGPSALGRLLGVSRQRVQNWRRQGYAPLDRVVEIEALTGVPRKKLIAPAILDIMSGVFE